MFIFALKNIGKSVIGTVMIAFIMVWIMGISVAAGLRTFQSAVILVSIVSSAISIGMALYFAYIPFRKKTVDKEGKGIPKEFTRLLNDNKPVKARILFSIHYAIAIAVIIAFAIMYHDIANLGLKMEGADIICSVSLVPAIVQLFYPISCIAPIKAATCPTCHCV